MSRSRRAAAGLVVGGWLLVGAASAMSAEPAMHEPSRQEMIRYAAQRSEGTWRKLAGPDAGLASRELFTAALALAEAKVHPDRLGPLFETAARMQDRDPKSRGYGNFRWSWSHPTVMDYNAVEFCMQGGSLLWMRHRDSMAAGARRTLREILDFAVEGCLRHRVRPAYTNIALMNAENLILLGETLDRPEVADEGYRRLDQIVMHTWEVGISEYGSPTYYGVDLDCLGLIEAFCKRERGRNQARALLELFWTDVAANWFPPSQRLGGPHSRDYNYLRGNGSVLETHLWAAGWLGGDVRGGTGVIWPALARWKPAADLVQMSRTRFPRLVCQSWNGAPNESRTHYLLADVALGSAAANYWNMDVPLTVDLPGDAEFPRCYFIPDARGDPYGKKRIPEGSGAHSKTLHLRPFWTAAQRTTDALGLVLYRNEDMTKGAETLESHFVMPRQVDDLWIGAKRVTLDADKTAELAVAPGEALVLRKGTAAVGVRVVWSRNVDHNEAPAALVADGNPHGVVRLTVTHGKGGLPADVRGAGAALWVRVGSGLRTDEAFDAWRQAFASAKADAALEADRVAVRVAGADGPVAVKAGYPDGGAPVLDPPPSRGVLELDGEDLGRRLLGAVEPVKSYVAHVTHAPPVALAPGSSIYLEAESGYVVAPMTVGEDPKASGGRYVWTPGDEGGRGGGAGRVLWNVELPDAAPYYVWGRVLAPTPEDDSFIFVATVEGKTPLVHLAWHTGVHKQWTWVRLAEPGSRRPAAVALPKGKMRLELRTREDGTKIDRLFISGKADAQPE